MSQCMLCHGLFYSVHSINWLCRLTSPVSSLVITRTLLPPPPPTIPSILLWNCHTLPTFCPSETMIPALFADPTPPSLPCPPFYFSVPLQFRLSLPCILLSKQSMFFVLFFRRGHWIVFSTSAVVVLFFVCCCCFRRGHWIVLITSAKFCADVSWAYTYYVCSFYNI